MDKPKTRCAIYTRKSHEEGLEQEFNSLDAQRMSGENYIASQSQEGWECLPTQYNDGGFTGGNLERPALQALFQDIRDGKIDCIVVYKIDRLTRSLLDFSEIIKLLDEHNCSFVAVTQSFNTSDSMGRLMLNVLLSFAQYERELTSERIRDKFEASCKLGIWMGGNPPLGYDPKDRKLHINEEEAKLVRIIYQRFLEVESPTEVARDMNELGRTTKTWISEAGKLHKGGKFTKKAIRRILKNPIYAGKISHKDNIYDGEHEAIIQLDMWDKVQEVFKRKTQIILPSSRVTKPPLLKGIFSCGCCGTLMTPTYTNKKGKRYRYYVCSSKQRGVNENCPVGTISASEAEDAVIMQVLKLLTSPEIIARTIAQTAGDLLDNQVISSLKNIDKVWEELFPAEQARIIHLLIKNVTITPEGMDISIYSNGIHSLKQELEAA